MGKEQKAVSLRRTFSTTGKVVSLFESDPIYVQQLRNVFCLINAWEALIALNTLLGPDLRSIYAFRERWHICGKRDPRELPTRKYVCLRCYGVRILERSSPHGDHWNFVIPIPDPDDNATRYAGMELTARATTGGTDPHPRLARNLEIFFTYDSVNDESASGSALTIAAMASLRD